MCSLENFLRSRLNIPIRFVLALTEASIQIFGCIHIWPRPCTAASASMPPHSPQPESWNIDGFASVALNDPILSTERSYTVKEESAALRLVAWYFNAYGWDFNQSYKSVLLMIKQMQEIPQTTSL